MPDSTLPLLPLSLDNVPPGLIRALAQQGVPFRRRAAGAAEGRFVLFDSRRGPCRPLRYGQVALDVHQLRSGWDHDPLESLLDERSGRHRWQITGLTVTQEIALVDKRAVRQKILERLRLELEQAGGVWLCVAAFPFPYRSALNFRIDYDQYDPRDFDTTLSTLAGNEQATSHFVNAAAYLPHDDALGRLRGLDVGSHGYRHYTYLTEEENTSNIRHGIETLRALGIEPSGFAAPHGRFNRGLLSALERLQVGHSSEFGLAYDELPFFPHDGNVLQIPVHPVSLGIFLEAVRGDGPRRTAAVQQAVRAAIDYFRETARAKYRAGEPVFFYGHPTGRLGTYPQVLRSVFDTADAFAAIWKTTLSEFAAWWRARAEVRLRVVRYQDSYVVTAGSCPAGYRLGIEYWRGRHVARMPLEGRVVQFSPSALAYENRAPRPEIRPVRVDRPQGLRGHIRRWIDWERETPVEEVNTTNWRNWAKRTLRRLRQ
jgi:peptidoglycan/xylan/chitin deacetylase (PgdA/CDA1 family)